MNNATKAVWVALALVLGGMADTAGAAPSYPVVAAQSSLAFIGSQQGERFTGAFGSFDARIEYAADDFAGSRFDVTIPLKSLDTKSTERDQALATADWFDVAHFPAATFRTVGMRATPAGVVADADLSIKGRTKRIVFPFSWKAAGTGATLDAHVTLDRLDFGLGGGEWADDSTVGRKIDVVVHLTLAAPVAPVAPAGKARAKAPVKR
jgi:polyisoprenoid-binding protein YceI